jgi:starch phosphorylase
MDAASLTRPRVAYFTMEIALADGMPTYSGGLGVLAGDMMRSAADLGVPIVAVTLASRLGYFRQEIAGGRQVERLEPWDLAAHARRLPAQVMVTIAGRPVWIAAWQFDVQTNCRQFHPVPVILLDTDLPENAPADRRLTDALYGGDDSYRLQQEIVLGIGGVRMLQALGVRPAKYHLNEGHSALLTLELLRQESAGGLPQPQAVAAVRRSCIFTTHTPVEAGHDRFPRAMVQEALAGLVEPALLDTLCPDPTFNMTRLALSLSGWVNGVADRHAETSRAMFPGYEVHAITNGVHPLTWTALPVQEMLDRHVAQWCHEPERLVRALRIPDAEILEAHARCKGELLATLAQVPGAGQLEARRFTIGFARRMTDYKRPGLLFADLERLKAIARRVPMQVIVSGKAHPHDEAGKHHIASLHEFARALEGILPVVFVPDYRLELARRLVAGADLWLNTPQPPMEASGTSGMKAALNGVPSLSVLDGWWLEGWEEGVTGWAIGEDGAGDASRHAASLYAKLEEQVLPASASAARWAAIMKSTIARNGSYFNSHRMIRRYVSEAYWA